MPKPGQFYRNDLHRLMSQPASFFHGHTPNWPKGQDSDRMDSITISLKITWEYDASRPGLTRKQAEALCKRLERCARGRSTYRIASAQI